MTKKTKADIGTEPSLKASILTAESAEKARLTALKIPTAKAIKTSFDKQQKAYGVYTDNIKICFVNGSQGIEVLGNGLALIVNSVVDSGSYNGLTGSNLDDAKEKVKQKALTSLNTLINRLSKDLFGDAGAMGISRGKEGFKIGGQFIKVTERKFKRSPNRKDKKASAKTQTRPIDVKASVLAGALSIVGNIKKIDALHARRTFLNLLFGHLGIGGVDLTKMFLVDENGEKLKKAS